MAGQVTPMGESRHESFIWLLESPAGMKIPCEIKALFQWPRGVIVDDAALKELRSAFTKHFGDWYAATDFTLSLGFSPVWQPKAPNRHACQPQIAPFHFTKEDVTVDGTQQQSTNSRRAKPNEFELTAAEVLKSFTWSGVTTQVVTFHKGTGWTREIIQENAQVAEEHDVIQPVDTRYDIAIEYAVAVLQKEIADLRDFADAKIDQLRERFPKAQTEHASSNGYFRITANRYGPDVRIEWTIHEGVADLAAHIVGFRREGGFHPNGWAGSPDNGTLEVDSRSREGVLSQHLEPGRTYYYTFYIPPWNETSLLGKTSSKHYEAAITRFQVRVPTVTELQAFDLVLKTLRDAELTVTTDRVGEELKVLRARLRESLQRHQGRAEIVRELFAEIEKNSTLSATDKRDLEEQVEAEAEKLWRSRR